MQITNDWNSLLQSEFSKPYFVNLANFVNKEYDQTSVLPQKDLIFRALNSTPYSNVKCVILGQDPYPNADNACGLSFSVPRGVKLPHSLRNIYEEMYNDLGLPFARHGDLTKWTEQGVLLLNTVLTVREGESNSHKGMGWENFTNRVITVLNNKSTPVVFILWGNDALSKRAFITNRSHHVIVSAHPSPFSARKGFFGSKPFSRTNQFLVSTGQSPIDWSLN